VQSGLIDQFRRLRAGREAGELALMLFSDVAGAALPHVLAHAQTELQERPPPANLEVWLRGGAEAHARARDSLAALLPRLIRALAEGQALDAK
jgi:hypothetical protein